MLLCNFLPPLSYSLDTQPKLLGDEHILIQVDEIVVTLRIKNKPTLEKDGQKWYFSSFPYFGWIIVFLVTE